MKSHTIEFTRDDLVVRITRYPAGEPGKSPSVEIEVESSGLPRSFVWFDREPQLFAFKGDARRIYRDVPADEGRDRAIIFAPGLRMPGVFRIFEEKEEICL